MRRVKLRSLVGRHWDPGSLIDGPLPGGAVLQEIDGPRGWVLIDDGSVGRFGGALAWAQRNERRELHVLVDDRASPAGHLRGSPTASSVVCRRAGEFASPAVVWRVQDRDLLPAAAASADPTSVGGGDVVPAPLVALAAQISAHGADPVVEHGVLTAEVLGLEVARAVADPDGGWSLAVGVGRHDREARKELRPFEPTDDALDDVIGLVRTWRAPGARRHPANSLATERWLRAAVTARPEIAGAVTLSAVPPPFPKEDLRDASPASAVGVDSDGRAVVVVCSTGVGVDLVPTAADTRLLHAPDARLVLVLAAVDAYPLTVQLAASLRFPAEIRTVGEDWTALPA